MIHQRARAVARRRKKLKGRDRDRASERAHLERILGLMGLRDHLGNLDDDAIRTICREFNPRPRVMPDPGRRGERDLATRARDLQGRLDRVAVRVGHDELSFNDYHSACMMLARQFMAGAAHPVHRRLYRKAAQVVGEFVKRHDDAMWEAYRNQTLSSLCEASAIDSVIYSARQELVQSGGRTGLTTTLLRAPAPSRTVEVGGFGRKAYRCGGFDDLETGEVGWVEWDARDLGLGDGGRLPVFVQSHALRQARERLGIRPDGLVHHALWRSLDHPVLTPIPGAYLVEYRILDHKLGYLVAERLGDLVLIRTFLLVTMQGTPEGSEFSRRLGLRRPDIDYLELDRLGTLIATDLARDPQVEDLLRGCGCGGVLDLGSKIFDGTMEEGYAARLRGYTGRRLESLSARSLAEPTG